MISGAHVIIYSKDAEADRAFLRDTLRFTHVDVGGGWLIFGLPPAEVAVHPADTGGSHELYLMCDDVEQLRAELAQRGIDTTPPHSLGWGILTNVTLPGGGTLGIYQPRHARPAPMDGAGKPVAASKPVASGPVVKKPASKRTGKQAASGPVVKKPTSKRTGKQVASGPVIKKPTSKRTGKQARVGR